MNYTKKDLTDPDDHECVVTHLEPDILEREVKWALGSLTMNKANRVDGIPIELFQILKDDVMKVLHSVCQQIWKTQQVATGLEKVGVHSNPKEGKCEIMFKLLHNCTISHTCKTVLQILQARLQQYVNRELPDVQAGFRKGRGTRIKWPTIIRSSKKQESSRKTSTSALLTMPKPLTVWITTNCGNL